MDSLKGTLYSIAIMFLILIPVLLEVFSMGIAVSQLNKVGAEMIQVIGSSSEYDGEVDVDRAIKIAKEKYKIDVELSTKDYTLGDEVELTLKKNITQFFNCESDTGREGCNADFVTNEKVMITKRGTD